MPSLHWLGHSTVVVDVNGTRVVTDPVLRRRVAHLVRDAAVPVDALGGVEVALVSHLHYDHLDLPSLVSLGRDLPVAVPRGAGPLLRRRRFGSVTEVEPGDELLSGTVRVVPAAHDGPRCPLGASGRAVGYVIGGVYFAGDTDLFAGMREIECDVAVLPVAGWGPTLPARPPRPAPRRGGPRPPPPAARRSHPLGTYHVVGGRERERRRRWPSRRRPRSWRRRWTSRIVPVGRSARPVGRTGGRSRSNRLRSPALDKELPPLRTCSGPPGPRISRAWQPGRASAISRVAGKGGR